MSHRSTAERRQPRHFIAIRRSVRDCILDRGGQGRRDALVGIEPQDPVAMSEAQGEVLLRAETQPLLKGDQSSPLARNLDRVVSAAAVDNDALVAEFQAVETVADVPPVVPRDDDRRNPWHQNFLPQPFACRRRTPANSVESCTPFMSEIPPCSDAGLPLLRRIGRTSHVMKGRSMIMQGVGVLILVTGGAGIIGSRLSRFLAGETDDLVVNVDS